MITNEMLLLVAQYDGWEIVGIPFFNPPYKILAKQTPSIIKEIPYISPSGNEYDDWAYNLKYAKSMDWLHPVSLKAYSELIDCKYDDISDITDKCETIHSTMMRKPINGQYIDLFKAVYEAILFINQNKATCNTN